MNLTATVLFWALLLMHAFWRKNGRKFGISVLHYTPRTTLHQEDVTVGELIKKFNTKKRNLRSRTYKYHRCLIWTFPDDPTPSDTVVRNALPAAAESDEAPPPAPAAVDPLDFTR